MVVVTTPCRLNSVRSPSSIIRISSPRHHALDAQPYQPLHQQKNENQHGRACTRRKTLEGSGEGQQKDRLDVENQEDDAVEVVFGLKLDPAGGLGIQAALVIGVLAGA